MLGLGQFSRTWPKRTVGFRSFVTKQHEDKKVSKSKELRKAALDVHKQLLFQVNKWPVVHGLEDRSLKLTLVPRVEQATQIVSETQDQTQILALGKQAQKDLQGALDLLTNKAFTKKHTLSVKWSILLRSSYKLETYIVPEMVDKHATLLSSKAQKKIRTRRWGIFDRLMTFFLDDSSTNSPNASDNKNEKPK